MKTIETFDPAPNFNFWPFNWVSNCNHPNGRWYKHIIHTFQFVKLFPMQIYQIIAGRKLKLTSAVYKQL